MQYNNGIVFSMTFTERLIYVLKSLTLDIHSFEVANFCTPIVKQTYYLVHKGIDQSKIVKVSDIFWLKYFWYIWKRVYNY